MRLRLNLRNLLWVAGLFSVVVTFGSNLQQLAKTHFLIALVIFLVASNWVRFAYWLLASGIKGVTRRRRMTRIVAARREVEVAP